MVKLKLKLLYIIISFLIFKPVLAEESWYQTAANQKAKHKHLVEGMTIFADYMAMANTEEKLGALLLKDK